MKLKLFKNKKLAIVWILFYVILYLVWTAKELVLHPALNQIIEDKSVPQILLFDWVLKNLFWTLPAVLLIRKFDSDLYLKKQELFQFPKQWKEALPILAFEILFCVANSVTAHKGFYFNPERLTECLAFVFVGVTEEFVFRGFLLNATLTEKNRKFAIGLNAVLFLCIHFPIWILYGNFTANFANFGFVTILLLSAFFSWAMLKYRNIWIPVMFHMVWDILVTLLN